MPVFIIYALGQTPQKVRADSPPVRVGREASNDLVIRDKTVSREHAMFLTNPEGHWVVSCVSDTNGVVVDGKLTRSGAPVKEGSQILIGAEHLVVFSENEITAKEYLGAAGAYSRGECATCHWKGMISTLRRNMSCPRCGGHEFLGLDRYESADAPQFPVDSPTRTTNLQEVKEIWNRLYQAKRSSIERLDGRDELGARVALQEDTVFELSKTKKAQIKLRGLVIGIARLGWDGDRWVLHSQMTYPSCRVNGEKVRDAPLKSGDVIEIGSNKLRFVVAT
jgi:pSer/pThr/pTyr-binding forkhead associated (FHA) protein